MNKNKGEPVRGKSDNLLGIVCKADGAMLNTEFLGFRNRTLWSYIGFNLDYTWETLFKETRGYNVRSNALYLQDCIFLLAFLFICGFIFNEHIFHTGREVI